MTYEELLQHYNTETINAIGVQNFNEDGWVNIDFLHDPVHIKNPDYWQFTDKFEGFSTNVYVRASSIRIANKFKSVKDFVFYLAYRKFNMYLEFTNLTNELAKLELFHTFIKPQVSSEVKDFVFTLDEIELAKSKFPISALSDVHKEIKNLEYHQVIDFSNHVTSDILKNEGIIEFTTLNGKFLSCLTTNSAYNLISTNANYKLIGKISKLSYGEASQFISSSIYTNMYPHYVKDIRENVFCYKSIGESLESLIKAYELDNEMYIFKIVK